MSRDEYLHIRVSADEIELWRLCAKAVDRSLGNWVRERLNRAAEAEAEQEAKR